MRTGDFRTRAHEDDDDDERRSTRRWKNHSVFAQNVHLRFGLKLKIDTTDGLRLRAPIM